MSEDRTPGELPARIDQLIPCIVEHDAVSNHTFEAQRLLQGMGVASEIYASVAGPGCEERVRPLAELSRFAGDDRWLLYQCSIGSPVAETFVRQPGGKLLDYHNITPASLVERFLPGLAAEARLGRSQLGWLAPHVDAAFADSGFNAGELEEAGFAGAGVVPLLVEAGNLETAPDPEVLARLGSARGLGGCDWLFVGQVAPHKAQHDIVKAFACYRRAYDPRARLHLVGREMGDAYRDALRRFVGALGLGEAVELAGGVTTGALAAYYSSADVFVCCSDHEGFCAPIVEAMHRGTPVVAFGAAAVPETLGAGGVVLPTKEPRFVAATVHELLSSPTERFAAAEAGRARARNYSLDKARRVFVETVEGACRGRRLMRR